jgi:hypothetical protein
MHAWTAFINFKVMHFSSLQYLNLIKKIWQVKLKFGQVSFFVTCPNGQVAKKVNVEPWIIYTKSQKSIHVPEIHNGKINPSSGTESV